MTSESFKYKNDVEIQEIFNDDEIMAAFNGNKSALAKTAIKHYAANFPRRKGLVEVEKPVKKVRRVVLEV